MLKSEISCPLCEAFEVSHFHHGAIREYFLCSVCSLVFVPSTNFLSKESERTHYQFHKNDPKDLRYRKFLSRLADPLMNNLAAGAKGLDFGCGPGPTLSIMLAEKGFPTTIFDPVFERRANVFKMQYDFITASEVVEHLHRPRFEFQRLWSCLHDGGVLGIMTKRRFDSHTFADWHYISDPTHVIFFSDNTFRWIAEWLSARLMIIGPDVVLLSKTPWGLRRNSRKSNAKFGNRTISRSLLPAKKYWFAGIQQMVNLPY